jgi:hypothetical protein
MLEPISTVVAIASLGYGGLNAYTQRSSAVSGEAVAVAEAASALIEQCERSFALFGERAAAIMELLTIARECDVEGWDGGDALAANQAAVFQAESFVRAMPGDLPSPEFSVGPNGQIILEWIASRERRFSLSIGESNRLSYAWLDGSDSGYAVASYNGLTVPSRVYTTIQTIVGNGSASLRAA